MKKNDYLKFTDFEIDQDERLFHVNSDTAALGTFFDNLNGKSILDIGTNNGALLLYASLKGATNFTGVDILEEALVIADKNLKRYLTDYELFNTKIQDFKHEQFDVIVSNPPFFEMNNPRASIYYQTAMFESNLSIDDLFESYRRLIKDNGEVYMIYPSDRIATLFSVAERYKFKVMKLRFIHDTKNEYASRILVKMKRGKITKTRVLKPIFINDGNLEI